MTPVMVPGPPSPPPPQPPGPTPPPRPPGPGRERAARAAIAAVLVLGTALVLTPLAVKVWTTAWIPAANRVHFGDGLVVALTLAGFLLYLLVSVLLVPRRTTAAADPRGTAADGAPTASQRAGRRQEEVAGRHVTPGGTA